MEKIGGSAAVWRVKPSVGSVSISSTTKSIEFGIDRRCAASLKYGIFSIDRGYTNVIRLDTGSHEGMEGEKGGGLEPRIQTPHVPQIRAKHRTLSSERAINQTTEIQKSRF